MEDKANENLEHKNLEHENLKNENLKNESLENKHIADAEIKKAPIQQSPMPANKNTNKKDLGLIGFFVIVVVINLVLTSGLIFLYDRFMAPKIVAVDIKGFVEKQRDLYVAKKINDEQLKANLDAMEKKIKSMPKNTIMISADVMVGENAKTIEP